MLGERTQKGKDRYHVILLICGIFFKKIKQKQIIQIKITDNGYKWERGVLKWIKVAMVAEGNDF